MSDASIFALIQQAEGDLRDATIKNLAAIRKVSVEALTHEFEAFQVESAKALERERKRQENAARKSRLEALATEAEGVSLDSDTLGDFVSRVVAEGGVVTINPDLTLGVTLPKAKRGGGTGGGKPAKDAPRPFLDGDGNRVTGAITDWMRDNLTEKQQQDANCFRPNGKLRTGAKLAKALVDAGYLTESPLD